jgi:hypothetical protein
MKKYEVLLNDRRRTLVTAEGYIRKEGKIIFLPEDLSGSQWFWEDKVSGVHVYSDDDDDAIGA